MSLAPGSAEYNLNGLAEFIKGLSALNDPDKAKRERVAANLADNPDLLQKYKQMDDATLEGILGTKAKFGPDKTAELIKRIRSTPDSAATQAAKIKSDAIQKVTQNNNTIGQIGVPFSGVDATSLNQVSTPQQNIYNQSVGLPTVEDAALTKLQTDNATLDNRIKTQNLGKLTDTETAASAARKYLNDNKLDAWTAYKNIKNLPPDVARGLTSDPDLHNAVQTGMTNEHYVKQEELQQQALSSKHNREMLLDQAEIAGAQHISQMSGASVRDIVELQRKPEQRQRYADPNFKPTTPEDQAKQSAAQALGELGSKLTTNQLNKAKTQYSIEVNRIMDEVDKGKKDPTAAKEELNRTGSILLGSLGIDAPTYEFGPEGDTRIPSLFPVRSGERFPLNPLGKQPKLYIKDAGDPRLGFTASDGTLNNTNNVGDTTTDMKTQAAELQSKIDSGEADFAATMADPRAKDFRHLLRAPNRKKK